MPKARPSAVIAATWTEVSPSQVNAGLACRHRHFLRHVARVPEDDLPLVASEPDRRDLGSAVHAALCEAVRRHDASPREVADAVLSGAADLPDSALHRLDYGISFGLMTSLGALAGLVPPLLRWPVLGLVAAVLVQDLLSFTDPLTGWGHPMALAIGIACWPLVRRWSQTRV